MVSLLLSWMEYPDKFLLVHFATRLLIVCHS